jgi:hypothetical protein
MFKFIILATIGYIVYKMFKKDTNKTTINRDNYGENDLVECSNCHTFVPKSECKFTPNGCLCKECQ